MIALAACMRELILIMDMVQLLAVAVGIPAGDVNIRVSVHEDNSGALVLAETLPPQFTPHSKYYATKTIWFCEEINKHEIKLLKIETSEQLGDMFTKVLAKITFEYLQSKIIGWQAHFSCVDLVSVQCLEYNFKRECRYRFSASYCSQCC